MWKRQYLANKSVVKFDNLRITVNPTTYSQLFYLYGDHLGSTSVITNSAGQLVDRATYLPFGGYRRGDSSILTESGFTGHLRNDSLGLIYMNARFYSPSSGRFISADTLVPSASDNEKRLVSLAGDFHEPVFLNQVNKENKQLAFFGPVFAWSQELKQELGVTTGPFLPQALNRYTYTLNNPLRYTDPSGHEFNVQWIDEGDGWWRLIIDVGIDEYNVDIKIHEDHPDFSSIEDLALDLVENMEFLNQGQGSLDSAWEGLAVGYIIGAITLIIGILLISTTSILLLVASFLAILVGIISLAVTIYTSIGSMEDADELIATARQNILDCLEDRGGLAALNNVLASCGENSLCEVVTSP